MAAAENGSTTARLFVNYGLATGCQKIPGQKADLATSALVVA